MRDCVVVYILYIQIALIIPISHILVASITCYY